MAHTYSGILAVKKEWSNVIYRNLGEPRDYYTKWSKSDKDSYHMILLIYRIWENDTNELIYKTEIDSRT